MAIKKMNDTAHDQKLAQERAMNTAHAKMQNQQDQERKDRERQQKADENQRDRDELAWEHSTKLQPSANRMQATSTK